MKLTKIRVRNFRNILDSGEAEIGDDVTCLVGKNESGKTAILQALNRLKPALAGQFDFGEDYPRWLAKRHRASGTAQATVPIAATFELDDADLAELADVFGDGAVVEPTVTVTRSYDNELSVFVVVDEPVAVERLLEKVTEPLVTPILRDVNSLDAVRRELDKATADAATEGADPDHAAQCAEARDLIGGRFGDKSAAAAVAATVQEWIPEFFYFDEYSQLPGSIEIQPLLDALRTDAQTNLTPNQRTALTLLMMASAGHEEMMSGDYEVRSGELEAVGADLTQQVLQYWSQNPNLRLKLDIDKVPKNVGNGTTAVVDKLRLRVEDVRHYFTNSLDARSSGFRWFVSFIAAFSEFRERNTPVIILLDEPGLSLHAKAQADLLRYINAELTDNQVIYSTHSPFLVETGALHRVRIVEDLGPDVGAKVSGEMLSTDPDTLFPLQGALGYDIAQSLFVGSHNLIVEGISDFTYLTILSDHLRSVGRTGLDERWTLTPVGGGDKVPTFVALLGAHLGITVLVDASTNGNQRLQRMAVDGHLKRQRIVTPAEATGTKEADIEDLFDEEDYLALYNRAVSGAIKLKDLKGADPIVRRISRLAGEFGHNVPADTFLRCRDEILPTLRPTSLDRFEVLITRLNATLGT